MIKQLNPINPINHLLFSPPTTEGSALLLVLLRAMVVPLGNEGSVVAIVKKRKKS
ncbi:MAG: hypothetical protein IPM42_08285 [Saprospiraceae bacterium]|nr:hypothetical protein [Saprospiraceae bacterium]